MLGRRPQAAFAVLVERIHRALRQAVLRTKAVDLAAADPAESVLRPGQHAAVVGLGQRQDRVVGQAVRQGQTIVASAAGANQPVARARSTQCRPPRTTSPGRSPHPAAAARATRSREPFHVASCELSPAPTVSVPSGVTHAALTSGLDRPSAVPNTRIFPLRQLGEAVRRARPHMALSILEQALNGPGRQPFALRIASRDSVLQLDQAGLSGADPQRVLIVFHQVRDPHVGAGHAVHFIDRREADAVELHQAGLRAEPQIAVVGLDDRIDPRLRQALLHLPDPVDVLRERPRGIERVRVLRKRKERQHESGPQPREPSHFTPIIRGPIA